MEDDLLKRNTDCVYFLASPLTCRKGMECEYRHNEAARLNPIDCWYWLAGSCLNPACCFRHPPLEGYTQVSTECKDIQAESASSLNKTNLPCYFYFNGFCYKGERCSFLHDPDVSESATKPVKTITSLPSVDKTSAVTDTGRKQAYTSTKSTETEPKPALKVVAKPKDIQQLAPVQASELSVPLATHGSEFEEAAPLKLRSLAQAEGIIQSRNQPCANFFLKDEAADLVEAEERWESSPDLDVLVEDRSERLCSEDDPENFPTHDRECTEHLLGYDLDEENDFEILNSEAGLLYERDAFRAYEHMDDGLILQIVKPPNHMRDRRLSSSFCDKRNTLSPFELPTGEQHGMDLRYRLRRHRGLDDHRIKCFSRRNGSFSLIGKNNRRLQGHGWSRQVCARLTSDVKRYIYSHEDHGNLLHRGHKRQSLRHVRYYHSKQHYSKKGLPKRGSRPLEVSRKRTSGERKGVQWSTTFSGPKSLAQIKEEKKKCEGNYEKMQHSTKIRLTDFLGPKPLSELLKEKTRSELSGDGTSGGHRIEGFH